jgi:sugar lactone lactonase YvrE
MRSAKLPTLVSVALVLVLFAPPALLAQYAISTVAGGGPNNLTALSASIGYPGSIAFDSAGNAYIADSNSSHIFKVDTTGNLTVVAGNGTFGYSGDGELATNAALNHPVGVFVDGSGNIFIADTDNCLIREVSGGNISTVAGDSTLTQPCGYAGDGGPATSAQLYDPYGVFVDKAGDIFIADTDNAIIREVVAGTIQTVAGTPGSPGYSGDGGLATSAELGLPEGVFVDGSGNIFIADTDNSVIREVTVTNSFIQTVVGTYYDFESTGVCQYSGDGNPPTSAYLCLPAGVFVDSSEDIYIADTDNLVIREVVAGGNIETVAGDNALGAGYTGNGGLATSAQLNYPNNMVVDSSGDIYIADLFNFVIREVTASNGFIATTVGNNTLAYSGDGGLAGNAELNAPGGVSLDSAGNFYIADTSNSVIRVVNTGTAPITIAGVTVQPGDIQTVAGSYYVPVGDALCDYSGDGGPPTSAQLCSPSGVFLDGSGNIFIADTQNNSIRVVNTQIAAITIAGVTIQPNTIATVAGNGTLCPDLATACGDGGAATSAELANPYGVFVDSAENIFIADTDDYVIREVAASSGTINTVAGNYAQCSPLGATSCGDGATATSAQLGLPLGVFVDPSENIYIADTDDNRIRVVANPNNPAITIAGVVIPPGDIATVAGTGARGYSGDLGPATSALLDTPFGVFVDASGDIFIADTENFVIREVVAATSDIQTVAGNNTRGFSGDGGQSTSAELNFPSGLAGNSVGNMFVADTDNQRIRELVPAIFVTVTPISVNVAISTQQQFTATVTGTSNTLVTWQVNGVAGGNSTVGTISTTGLFQAPATIPSPATVTITAISQADNTTSGLAQATIVGVGGAVNVAVTTSPAVTEVYTSTTQTFMATVTGTTNMAVTWQVNGTPGGNAMVGTIDTSGNYTGPAAVPTPNPSVVIEAVSQALSSAIGAESVMIVTNPSAAQPAPQTSSPGGQATYSLLLNENTGDPKYAITLSCLQSSLPPNATCGFTPSTITPGPIAVSFTLTITVPSGSASLEKRNGMRPQLYFAFLAFAPLAGILFAGVGLRNKRRRWLWLAGLCVFLILLNACGGSSSPGSTNPELGTYNVKVQGTTTAQPNPVTITIAGLTVQ